MVLFDYLATCRILNWVCFKNFEGLFVPYGKYDVMILGPLLLKIIVPPISSSPQIYGSFRIIILFN